MLQNGNIRSLHSLLTNELKGCFGTVHMLPFFHPIDGADAGFDPIDHTLVDPRLGTWEDVKALSEDIDVMADLIVNHVSDQSPQFQDYYSKGAASDYASLFLTMSSVFPKGASEADLLKIYRPRPGLPFTVKTLANGSSQLFWTTFTPNQLDINIESESGKQYLSGILNVFSKAGIKSIRMDATGYAIKRAGTSCFMLPETYDFIDSFTDQAHALGMEVLVEIHSYYKDQIEIAKKVDWVYDFALPPLILHSIFRHTSKYLAKWLQIAPRNCLTVLDTHDGIGVIDVGSGRDAKTQAGLLDPLEIDFLVEEIHKRSQGESKLATGAAASNLDLYQVNCTFFDALGKNEQLYLLARAIQFFSAGIPQIYYVGLLGGVNDPELLARTNVGRDINRHYFSKEEVTEQLNFLMVKSLIELIRFRNGHNAFNGAFSASAKNENHLTLTWTYEKEFATLDVDFNKLTYQIHST
jgi:sucrose phosphorylase